MLDFLFQFVYIKKTALIDFLKIFNGNAMLPIYEGSSDFHSPYKKNSPLAASLIMPLTEKIKTIFRKGISKSEFASANSQDYHPHAKFVSHLAFNSVKKVPAHLATVDNSKRKPKSTFVRRYINLENGFIYKLVDDKYVKVDLKLFQNHHKEMMNMNFNKNVFSSILKIMIMIFALKCLEVQ